MELTICAAGGDAGACVVFGAGCGDTRWAPQVDHLIRSGRFDPAKPQVKLLDSGASLVILVGCPEAEDVRHLKGLMGQAVRMAREEKADTLEIDLDTYRGGMEPAALVRAAAQAAWEGNYVFDAYRSQRAGGLTRVCLKCARAEEPAIGQAFAVGERLGRAVAAMRSAAR